MSTNPPTHALNPVVPRRRHPLVRLIAVFKLVKAVLLIAAAVGTFKLLSPDFADRAEHWLGELAVSYNHGPVPRFLAWLSGLSERRLKVLGVVALLYAVLYTVEGFGLWRERRWAEYLTVIATSSFVPIELYEIARRVTTVRVGALILNLAIVAYLIYRVRHSGWQRRQQEAGHRGPV